jgi:hypothetical protein
MSPINNPFFFFCLNGFSWNTFPNPFFCLHSSIISHLVINNLIYGYRNGIIFFPGVFALINKLNYIVLHAFRISKLAFVVFSRVRYVQI